MSVDIEKLIVEAGHDPQAYVTTPRWVGSLRLLAGDFRAIGLQVGYHPIEENPCHGEVWGTFDRQAFDHLRRAAHWFVAIDGAFIA